MVGYSSDDAPWNLATPSGFLSLTAFIYEEPFLWGGSVGGSEHRPGKGCAALGKSLSRSGPQDPSQ